MQAANSSTFRPECTCVLVLDQLFEIRFSGFTRNQQKNGISKGNNITKAGDWSRYFQNQNPSFGYSICQYSTYKYTTPPL